jgi:hypothetical protein
MQFDKQILIHIGTSKTGSTSIQRALAKSSRKGQLEEIYYPLPLGGHNHQEIVIPYHKSYEKLPRQLRCKHSPSDFEVIRRGYLSDLFEQLRQHNKVIICSEYLGSLNIEAIQRFRTDLENLGFIEFKVLIYIRKPASHYLSYIQQQLKASSKFSTPAQFRYRFLESINCWSKVFQPESLEIRIFQAQNFPDGSVVLDFNKCASKFFKTSIQLEDESRNTSISAEGMIILQKYRRLVYPDDNNVFKKDSTLLISLLRKSQLEIHQTKPKLSRQALSTIIRSHEKDINILKDYYGIDISELDQADQEKLATDNTQEISVDRKRIETVLDSFDQKTILEVLIWIIKNQLNNKTVK